MPKNELDQKESFETLPDEIATNRLRKKAKYAEDQAKNQQDQLAQLQASFKTSCNAYYQLSDEFNRFNLPWPSRDEDFPVYEARYAVSHVISNLQVISHRLNEILQAMITTVAKFNDHNSHLLLKISSNIATHKVRIYQLLVLIKNYESTKNSLNSPNRLESYKAMAEAVQHMQYSLQFSLKTQLQKYHNQFPNTKHQPPAQKGLQSLPLDTLKNICGYLSNKEIISLSSTHTLFYGKRQKSNFNFNLIAKKRRLLELKNIQYFYNKISNFLLINNKVYAWGDNRHGQLGVGDNRDYHRIPTEINFNHLNLAPGDKIRQVIVGDFHTIFLTEQGRCFGCGLNRYYRLGVGDNRDYHPIPIEINFNHLNLAPGDKIKQVIVSGVNTIFFTEQGRCFGCGYDLYELFDGNNIHRLIEISFNHLNLSIGDNVKQVGVGDHFVICLTEQGRCFGMGNNSLGELGVGDYENRALLTEITFNHLNLTEGDKIKQVIVGGLFTMFLTEHGRCFGCGYNFFGQLGVGDKQKKNIPTEIALNDLNLTPGDKIKQVTVGDNSVIYLTEQGCCLISGKKIFDMRNLKDDSINSTYIRPKQINLNYFKLFWGDKVQDILCRPIFYFDSTYNFIKCMTKHKYYDLPYDLEGYLNDYKVFDSTPEAILKKHQLIESIINDISQLAIFASENTDYGINFKQILIRQSQIEPYPWVHETFFNELPKIATAKEQKYLIISLNELLYLYDCLNNLESPSDQIAQILMQKDYMELLQKLNNGEISDFLQLNEYFLNIVISESYTNISNYNLKQELMMHNQDLPLSLPEAFNTLKIAANIILQGLYTATKENGVAFILRNFIVEDPTSSLFFKKI